MRIQHNIAALNAYRNLTNNNSSVSKNLEKLSSGYRINRAGDDAAGLAISEKMRAQITGLNTAQKNASDGISLVQTAEGALTEVHSMLNRMVELANQSANGTYANEPDRENLQAEIDSLKDEINRISKSTNFNGINLLDGSLGTTTTAADEIATGFKDISATAGAITPVADGALAEEPVKGEFSLDLTDLVMRNDGVKATLGGTTTPTVTAITNGDGTDEATFDVDLGALTVTPVDGATNQGSLEVKIGDQTVKVSIPTAGIETAGAGWTAGSVGEITLDDNGTAVTFAGTIDAAGKITFTATTKDTTTFGTTAPTASVSVAEASDAPVKATVSFGAAKVELGSVEIKSGESMTGAEWAEEFMESIKAQDNEVTIDGTKFTVTNNNGKLSFKMVEDPTKAFETDLSVSLEIKDGAGNLLAQAGGNGTDNDGNSIANDNDLGAFINQGHGIGVHIDTKAVPSNGRVLAQGELDLSTLGIKDGTALKIGDETYIFSLGAESKFKDAANVIDLSKYETMTADAYADASRQLSKVAAGNKMFDVSTDNTSTTTKVLLTERADSGIDYSKNNLEGSDKTNLKDHTADAWKDLIQVGKGNPDAKPAVTSGGLILQIGDTSDDFNKMTVSIGSMSADSLGIGDVDISTQEGAAEAVDKIKAAINQVSSQRGDLGAIQNRLEHTINNLSVAAENITAAESRIRDVDMAEEMMAYTKNNILVQAAQAMLAQANQVPQGVLQLLQ